MENNSCNASKRLPWIVQHTFNAKFIGHIWRPQQLEEIAKKNIWQIFKSPMLSTISDFYILSCTPVEQHFIIPKISTDL